METLSFVFIQTFLIIFADISFFLVGAADPGKKQRLTTLQVSSSPRGEDETTCLDEGFPQRTDRFVTLLLPGDT